MQYIWIFYNSVIWIHHLKICPCYYRLGLWQKTGLWCKESFQLATAGMYNLLLRGVWSFVSSFVSVPDSNFLTIKFSNYFTCMSNWNENLRNSKRTKLINRESWSNTLYMSSKSRVKIGNVFSMLTVSVRKCWTLVCYNLVPSWWVWPPVTLWQS